MIDSADDTSYQRLNELIRRLMEGPPSGDDAAAFAYGFHVTISNGDCRITPEGGDGRRAVFVEPEVHATDDAVYVVVELPGATAEDLAVSIGDGEIAIAAETPGAAYRSEAALPPVDPATLRTSCRHGVVEIAFSRRPAGC